LAIDGKKRNGKQICPYENNYSKTMVKKTGGTDLPVLVNKLNIVFYSKTSKTGIL
jgi:hypothetical protein